MSASFREWQPYIDSQRISSYRKKWQFHCTDVKIRLLIRSRYMKECLCFSPSLLPMVSQRTFMYRVLRSRPFERMLTKHNYTFREKENNVVKSRESTSKSAHEHIESAQIKNDLASSCLYSVSMLSRLGKHKQSFRLNICFFFFQMLKLITI